jgi:hypothetical protein
MRNARFPFCSVYGVDFSGAALAGKFIWLAHCQPHPRGLRLIGLHNLEALVGTAQRDAALAHLVKLIRESEAALWAMDFPFGLPIEVMNNGARWRDQLNVVGRWRRGAYAFGERCLARARRLGGASHIRRTTDTEAKTPFDCYHYRIIYQTFHGMRDVLLPLAGDRGTAVAPFDRDGAVRRASRVLVEACPASTLKRLGLPHQNYKQPTGGPLSRQRRRVRGRILEGLRPLIEIDAKQRWRIMRNCGGDALDAVIAAVGAWHAWTTADHLEIARHRRYSKEGFLYC